MTATGAPTKKPNSADTPDARRSWTKILFNRKMLTCIFLGFTSGMPLYFLISLIPAWLRVEGVGLKEIGFFSLVQLPYVWKFEELALLKK